MDYKEIPKIELHVHLDGSVKIETMAKLANISIDDAIKYSVAPYRCDDLNDYLKRFDLPISVMQTYSNLELISYELAKSLKEDNVVYAEIRFAPNKHLSRGLSYNQVIEAVISGLNKVNIKTKLILCMMRNDSIEQNKKIIDLAKIYPEKVVGVDLAGAEAIYKTAHFKELFDYAKSLNVKFTIHAGEADGISSINSALDFGTKRIGHGIRCIDDIDTIKRIKDDRVLLEICPTSNIQTGVVESYETHPFYELYKKGIMVSLNTDNRTVSNTTLSNEYKKMAEAFSLKYSDFVKINNYALECSFLDSKEKKEISKLINISYNTHTNSNKRGD